MHQTLDMTEVKRLVEKESYTTLNRNREIEIFSKPSLGNQLYHIGLQSFQTCDCHELIIYGF
jgi:hypothetical protein